MAYIIRMVTYEGKRVKAKAWKGGISIYRKGHTETAPARLLDIEGWEDFLPANEGTILRRLWTDYRELEATQP